MWYTFTFASKQVNVIVWIISNTFFNTSFAISKFFRISVLTIPFDNFTSGKLSTIVANLIHHGASFWHIWATFNIETMTIFNTTYLIIRIWISCSDEASASSVYFRGFSEFIHHARWITTVLNSI